MNVSERLSLIQFKIDRANQHIANLDSAIQAFFNTRPYQISTTRDATRRLIYYLSSVQATPASLPIITGDAIQNLRSALDHLAYQLFLVGTNQSINGHHIYFPIHRGVAEYQSNLSRQTQGMRQDVISTLNAIQPYKGGKGDRLWQLHTLNLIDKHRLLVTVGSAYQSFNVGAYMRPMMQEQAAAAGIPNTRVPDLYLRPADNLFPLKAGDKLFVDAVDAEVNNELDFRFNIVLNEVGIVQGAPLLDTLKDFSNLVSQTVQLFTTCLS